jgi:hypothetical protein
MLASARSDLLAYLRQKFPSEDMFARTTRPDHDFRGSHLLDCLWAFVSCASRLPQECFRSAKAIFLSSFATSI